MLRFELMETQLLDLMVSKVLHHRQCFNLSLSLKVVLRYEQIEIQLLDLMVSKAWTTDSAFISADLLK
jgi:hypothetical protein